MSSEDLVTAEPGQMWLMAVKVHWPPSEPLWTVETGWHPGLRTPVEDFLRQAQNESIAPMLVSPPAPAPHLPYIGQTVAANGVRAFIVFDVELGERICQLQTMEAFPVVPA